MLGIVDPLFLDSTAMSRFLLATVLVAGGTSCTSPSPKRLSVPAQTIVATTTTSTAPPSTVSQNLASTAAGTSSLPALPAPPAPPGPPSPAKAVVSLSPTATETLFALGAGALVRAVDSGSTYPPSAPRSDLSAASIDVTKVMAMTPDLVVVASDIGDAPSALAARGVRVLVQPPARSLNEAYAQIRQLGEATGRSPESENLVALMQSKIAAIIARTPQRATPVRYYHERNGTFASLASTSFLGQIYALLGARSIADGAPGDPYFPTLTSPFVIDANPDLIVLADAKCCHVTIDTVRARPEWQTINAVKNNAIALIDDDLASTWGPRVVDLLQAISGRLLALPAS